MRRWLVLLALVACSGEEHVQLGEACTTLSTYVCPRLGQCGAFPQSELQACQDSFVAACCGGPPNRCGQDSIRTQEELDDCTNAITSYGCTALLQGVLPSICITGG